MKKSLGYTLIIVCTIVLFAAMCAGSICIEGYNYYIEWFHKEPIMFSLMLAALLGVDFTIMAAGIGRFM